MWCIESDWPWTASEGRGRLKRKQLGSDEGELDLVRLRPQVDRKRGHQGRTRVYKPIWRRAPLYDEYRNV